MIGKIHLIKNENKKVIPAICVGRIGENYSFLQLISSNEDDEFNSLELKLRLKINKGKPENRQKKIIHASKNNRFYIGILEGLRNESSVLLDRRFTVNKDDILKELASFPKEKITQLNSSYKNYQDLKQLKNEMYMLKRKIDLAKLNNLSYRVEDKRLTEVLHELKFPSTNNSKSKKPYENFREVPNKSGIKVFRG